MTEYSTNKISDNSQNELDEIRHLLADTGVREQFGTPKMRSPDESDGVSNKSEENNLSVEDGLNELRRLLLGTGVQEQFDAPKMRSPDLSDVVINKSEENNLLTVEDGLNEVRNLLVDAPEMRSPLSPDESNESEENDTRAVEDGLHELRNLLFGSEFKQRSNTPDVDVEYLSKTLPEAIILRSLQDEHLTKALVPTVEEAIKASVTQDIDILTNALFPVIGPATRKAISAALNALTQSLQQSLDTGFSVETYKWRLEALQTGKSYAEVVMIRSLIYQVEQVFLIHKETGLLLQHAVAETVAPQDADLVSAMLTAIGDFVHDSFSVQTGDWLETLQFGDLTIWVEQGPQAILASVIRGNAPKELRLVFQKTIENIHLTQSRLLESFRGDTAPFEASKPYIEACLQSYYKPQKQKSYLWLGILGGTILSGLLAGGFWGFFYIRESLRWTAYLEKLNSEQGIVVVNAEKRNGKYFIYGLRDPLAADPIAIKKQANVNSTVISRWEPYASLSPEFMAARAKQVLQPPKTVSLSVDENGILYATGSAPHQWVAEARKLSRAITGITQFREVNLIDLKELERSKEIIEKQLLLFAEGTAQLIPGQNNKLTNLVREIKKLSDIAPFLDKDVSIQVVGRANADGPEQTNIILSQKRVSAILSILTAKGLKTTKYSLVGAGSRQPLRYGVPENDKAFNRSVSFKVILTDNANKGRANP